MKKRKSYYKYTDYGKEPNGLRKLNYIVDVIMDFSQDQNFKNIKILDFGCGRGNISMPLASLGYNVLGIDLDEKSINDAKRKNKFKNANFEVGDILKIPKLRAFDCVIASEIIEHVADPMLILKIINSKMKNNGLLIVSIPNGYSVEEIIRRFTTHTKVGQYIKRIIKNIFLSKEKIVQTQAQSPHLHFFSLKRMQRLIKRSGFKILGKYNSGIFFKQCFYLLLRVFIKRGSRLFKFLDRIDGKISDVAPLWMGDGWIIVACKKGSKNYYLK